ncbi:hypothetical protein Tco_0319674 [Tanacetum coccineum]
MTTLKFVDTHNMVTFLAKPTKSEGFELIVDFLNANPIKYALTINPTVYTSCIEQFWATVKAKTVNGEVQLQALVDGKKIIITELIVRRDLQLEDVEGVYCLPNATIFEQLTLMGSKTNAWNEFSSTMASAIICLATNHKFNFSKYIFESMMKNLDNVSGNFLMYPRFIQVFVKQQLEGMPTHKRIYIAPSHTKKIFRNMRRVGKAYETVNEEMDDNLERAATTTTGLEAEKDSGNIDKTQSKPTLNEPSSSGTSSGIDGIMYNFTIKSSYFGDYKDHSSYGDYKFLASQKKDTHFEVVESFGVEESLDDDASKQRRINIIDADEDITLLNNQDDADMFDVNTLASEEVFVAEQTLAELKRAKPKADKRPVVGTSVKPYGREARTNRVSLRGRKLRPLRSYRAVSSTRSEVAAAVHNSKGAETEGVRGEEWRVSGGGGTREEESRETWNKVLRSEKRIRMSIKNTAKLQRALPTMVVDGGEIHKEKWKEEV